MRLILRRLVFWALDPTPAERARMGMLPDEDTRMWLLRRRAEAQAILPTLNAKASQDFLAARVTPETPDGECRCRAGGCAPPAPGSCCCLKREAPPSPGSVPPSGSP